MAYRSTALALALASALALLPVKGDATAQDVKPPHKPSATCTDFDLEEARVTEQLAAEPDRLWWKVTDEYLAIFKWNMSWAFDADVEADIVYIIEAKTVGSTIKSVHVFTVKKGCITQYTATWGSLIAEMLRWDAWERGNPPVDGQLTRTVPANRPPKPATPGVHMPAPPPPGLQP
jgi:hypothetical protein